MLGPSLHMKKQMRVPPPPTPGFRAGQGRDGLFESSVSPHIDYSSRRSYLICIRLGV